MSRSYTAAISSLGNISIRVLLRYWAFGVATGILLQKVVSRARLNIG